MDGKDQVVPIEGEHDGYFSYPRDHQEKGLADSLVSLSIFLYPVPPPQQLQR